MNLVLAIVFLAVFGFIFYKNRGVHPELFNLIEGEEIIEISKGDYWKSFYFITMGQKTGEIAFTNKRILFQGSTLDAMLASVSVNYNEILSVEKCFIGPLLPFGIKIKITDDKSHIISVLKRSKCINLIKSLVKQSSESNAEQALEGCAV